MRNLMITIEYDGTDYYGWQRQPNARSVQQCIEEAIFKITKKQSVIFASGRTDAGVHALAQTANFFTDSNIPCDKMVSALNSVLSYDISITDCAEVSEDFHCRYLSKNKTYEYRILNTPHRRPMERNYAYHVRGELDINLMNSQAKKLIGKHDFKSFCSLGSSTKTTVRTIYNIDLSKQNDIITLTITGNGFLYNMVRIIASTLIQIGLKKKDKDILEILESKDRKMAGPTAPACGLFLKNVSYDIDMNSNLY